MNKPWRSLEEISYLAHVALVWKQQAGRLFHLFRALCLDPMQEAAELYPCQQIPACTFRVIRQPGPPIIGQCQRNPGGCPPITLSLEDITPLEFNWQKFGRALCRALNLDFKYLRMPIFQTAQIGTWSTVAVPVFLTIQNERCGLRHIAADLTARINSKFILLAPSDRLFDAYSLEHLNRVRAAFFPLDNIITMTEQGTLQSIITPGELFQKFIPQVTEAEDNIIARQTLALAMALDAGNKFRKAPLLKVFLSYCAKGLTAEQIARECKCARSVVFARLAMLRNKLGRHPPELRTYSPHFEKIEASISDARARRIRLHE